MLVICSVSAPEPPVIEVAAETFCKEFTVSVFVPAVKAIVLAAVDAEASTVRPTEPPVIVA